MLQIISIFTRFHTPRQKKNSSPLKNDAWNTILLLGPGLFSGGELLNFRREKSLHFLGSDHLQGSGTDEAEKVASRIGHVGTARCSEIVQRAIGSWRLREKPDLTQGQVLLILGLGPQHISAPFPPKQKKRVLPPGNRQCLNENHPKTQQKSVRQSAWRDWNLNKTCFFGGVWTSTDPHQTFNKCAGIKKKQKHISQSTITGYQPKLNARLLVSFHWYLCRLCSLIALDCSCFECM